MLSRRTIQVGGAVAALLGPFAAAAHATIEGTVTTAPVVSAPAPAIGMPVMVLLAVLLAAGGAYILRRARGGALPKIAVVAALAALAGLAYATDGMGTIYTVTGPDCGTTKTFTFDAFVANELRSNCPNLIRIIDLKVDCTADDPLGECTLGQVLTNGQFCTLPECTIPTPP